MIKVYNRYLDFGDIVNIFTYVMGVVYDGEMIMGYSIKVELDYIIPICDFFLELCHCLYGVLGL